MYVIILTVSIILVALLICYFYSRIIIIFFIFIYYTILLLLIYVLFFFLFPLFFYRFTIFQLIYLALSLRPWESPSHTIVQRHLCMYDLSNYRRLDVTQHFCEIAIYALDDDRIVLRCVVGWFSELVRSLENAERASGRSERNASPASEVLLLRSERRLQGSGSTQPSLRSGMDITGTLELLWSLWDAWWPRATSRSRTTVWIEKNMCSEHCFDPRALRKILMP